jgi:hypothetical protein
MAITPNPSAINPNPPRSIFRVVKQNPPAPSSFLSVAAQGRGPKGATQAALLTWLAVSTFTTAAEARKTARMFPKMGAWIAEVDLRALRSNNWISSWPSSQGHIDLYNVDPGDLSQAVVAVQPV